MDARGALGHEQLVADLAVASPTDEEGEHLPLAPREAEPIGRIVGGVDPLEPDPRPARDRLQSRAQRSRAKIRGDRVSLHQCGHPVVPPPRRKPADRGPLEHRRQLERPSEGTPARRRGSQRSGSAAPRT